MIDGRSVAYRTTSGNWLGIELVPLETVKQNRGHPRPRVGPRWGGRLLGVVNIITEKPDDVRPLRARASLGFTGKNPGATIDLAGGGQVGPFDLCSEPPVNRPTAAGSRCPLNRQR